ncbi:phage baseplate assembly protein V [Leptolyngbya ohadii]|uniref:phage baseplate assembly protein V n=1 Tax=Leptolyngbya ohadii TaxID=1962290 RepID=UPI000B59E948|nr:phage baseplate assembly protein V [Leptolyngbya ohadii]
MRRFLGKYRGKVTNNVDPLQRGRLQVSVPSILGEGRLSWAMPSVPYAGRQVGWFALPPINANLWVEFEAGDPDYPIWTGCFWGQGEMPVTPAIPGTKVFRTESTTVTVSDLPGVGGVTIEVKPPAVTVPLKMTFQQQAVEITCGTAVITIAIDGIDLKIPPAEAKLSPTGIELSMLPGAVKLTPGSIDLSHGAASVKLSAATVNVNNGALEVL